MPQFRTLATAMRMIESLRFVRWMCVIIFKKKTTKEKQFQRLESRFLDYHEHYYLTRTYIIIWKYPAPHLMKQSSSIQSNQIPLNSIQFNRISDIKWTTHWRHPQMNFSEQFKMTFRVIFRMNVGIGILWPNAFLHRAASPPEWTAFLGSLSLSKIGVLSCPLELWIV